MILPMAESVAVAEPVSRPKAMQASVVTAPTLPRTLPMMESHQSISADEMPLCSIRTPARMKVGTARNGKLSMAEKEACRKGVLA